MANGNSTVNDHDVLEYRTNKSGQLMDLIGVEILSCGDLYSESGELLCPRSGCRQLYFVFAGKGIVRNGSSLQEINEGTAFVLFSEEGSIYQADHKDPWRCAWINLTGDVCDNLLATIGFSKKKPYIRIDQMLIKIIRRILNSLDEDRSEPETDPVEVQLYRTGRLLQLFSLLRGCSVSQTENDLETGMNTNASYYWLNRRSQKKSYNWVEFLRMLDTCHPLTEARLYVSIYAQ